MIFIITLLFYLYILVVALTIVTLLLITPILMEKLPWTNEKKVLTILPLYLFFIPLAVISIWKFQDWKVQEEIRTGHAKISTEYRDFLENKYPQLGKNYQRVLADHYILKEDLHHMHRNPVILSNHMVFIKDITQRRLMILDQLKHLKNMLEIQALRPDNSSNAALILEDHVDFYLTEIKRSEKLIEISMRQHVSNSVHFLNDPRSRSLHYPINKQNYDDIINFFLKRYGHNNNLIDSLDVIVQTIHQSKLIIQQLSHKLSQRKLYESATIRAARKAWQQTYSHSHNRLFKILYSLETEYVLQSMKMQENHPSMQKLHAAINQAIPNYSREINVLRLVTEENNNPKTVLALH